MMYSNLGLSFRETLPLIRNIFKTAQKSFSRRYIYNSNLRDITKFSQPLKMSLKGGEGVEPVVFLSGRVSCVGVPNHTKKSPRAVVSPRHTSPPRLVLSNQNETRTSSLMKNSKTSKKKPWNWTVTMVPLKLWFFSIFWIYFRFLPWITQT